MDDLDFRIKQMDVALRVLDLTGQAERALQNGEHKKAEDLIKQAEEIIEGRQKELMRYLAEKP